MRIIKTIYQYKYSASEVIAGFKNKIITIMNEQDQKDLEKMRECKAFLDGKIVELLNK